jgi:hypothetical protein
MSGKGGFLCGEWEPSRYVVEQLSCLVRMKRRKEEACGWRTPGTWGCRFFSLTPLVACPPSEYPGRATPIQSESPFCAGAAGRDCDPSVSAVLRPICEVTGWLAGSEQRAADARIESKLLRCQNSVTLHGRV